MKFKIYTLGCKVNTYETNVMREQLQKHGFEEDNSADIIIINTCTVTNTADHKSMKMIHHAVREKKENGILIVVGCLSQVDAERVAALKEVDIILGNKYKSKIATYIEQFLTDHQPIVIVEDIMTTPFETMKLNNFNRTRAFVKIQDGCNNFCSYCIIPYSRGNVRSKDPLDVLDEVKTLVKMGHKEIVLTGIHTGHYGTEFDHYEFADLLTDLLRIDGLERLRISSIEMNEITPRVIQLLKTNPILVDHMHIPIQSGCDKVLKDMNRKYQIAEFALKLQQIRQVRPNISISTDLIVGFPTESDQDFAETLATLRQLAFSNIHVFPYSARRGTQAASLPDLNGVIKKQRVRTVMELSRELEQSYNDQFIGQVVTFIPEVEKDGYLIGHTGNYLLVKALGDATLLYQTVPVCLTKVVYPYIEAEVCQQPVEI